MTKKSKDKKAREGQKSSRGKSAAQTQSPKRKTRIHPDGLRTEAVSVLSGAEKLHSQVSEVHSQTEALHESVRSVSKTLTNASRFPEDESPEAIDIVTEERRLSQPTSFPIV